MQLTLRLSVFAVLFSTPLLLGAQSWNGKKCAVVLSYDDALQVHLDNVVPALDSAGFKGTFYVSGNFPGFKARVADWEKIATKGHELGNHSMFHPCTGGPGREWVRPEYDLRNYTAQRMRDEIIAMNTMLKVMDGKTARTFAYPCADTKIGDVSYLAGMESDFTAARGVKSEIPVPGAIDVYNVPSYAPNGQSGDELIALVKKAIDQKGLLVFTFHGVGGEHSINVSLPAHRALIRFLREMQGDVWVGTFADIAAHVRKLQMK